MTDGVEALLRRHPRPEADGGKTSRGDLVIVGGAPSCPGSAILAGRAALRLGAGRVQLVVHPEVAPAVGAAFPEALVLGWDHASAPPEAVARRLSDAAAVIVGPGLDDHAVEAAVAAAPHLDGALLVVDALALPALDHPAVRAVARLAAPNPQEAVRLVGDGAEGEADDHDLADLVRGIAALVHGPAAVRGGTTVIDDGDGAQWELSSTVPGLGTPGSGDVLMGALGALLAQGASPLTALGWAVATHARAGRILGQARPVGFLAGEVADALPEAVQALDAEVGR
jgi:hydroxyethylthiazole kinase-like uncharacterized protein yjeF